MKQITSIIICAAVLLVSFAGCNKGNTKSDRAYSDSLAGSWELLQRSGGMTPAVDYPAGNGSLIKFTGATYELYKQGQLVKSGRYEVLGDASVKESVCLELPPGKFSKRIIYDSSYTSNKIFIDISGDTLTFISGCYAVDAGQSSMYTRQLSSH